MTAASEARSVEATQAMRDYLGAIDLLGDGEMTVTTQRIAHRLGVSCPSVTNMIKRLHERGLVDYAPYHGVRLTETGLAIAESTARRRHLLERYLIEKLGYDPKGARIDATRLERAVTGALEMHIEAALSAPLTIGSGTPRLATIVGAVDSPFVADAEHLA